MTAVPLIDLTPWSAGDADARRAVATDLDRALCEVGALVLTGHGLPGRVAARLRAEAGPFFALPERDRAAVACFPGGRGWAPPAVGEPGAAGTFGFGPDVVPPAVAGTAEEEWFGPNAWPADVPGLRPAATAFAAACADLADELLRVAALALDLPEEFLVARCAGNTWAAELTRSAGPAGTVPRTELGTLTLLDLPAGAGALQVGTPDGGWADAPAVPGALAVVPGELLARWTGDRWRCPPHRVAAPGPQLSLAYAHAADPLAVVETLPTAAAGPTRYGPVTAGAFRRGRTDWTAVA